MLSLLRTRRWQGFTVLVIVAIIAFGILSRWQWARAQDKQQDQFLIEQATQIPVTSLDAAATPWQRVEIDGSFVPEPTLIVRQRPMDGANGVWVVNQFLTAEGERVWVNRGWVPAARSARDLPQVPPTPTGLITLGGAWVPFEEGTRRSDLPPGMIPAVAPSVLPPGASVDGFIHMDQPRHPDMLAVAAPRIDSSQNLSYAMQWLAFAFVAIAGWWFMLRREARDQDAAN